MKKWWMSVAIAALVLSACGEAEQAHDSDELQTVTTYDETFTHEMEGVRVTMDGYRVETLKDVTEAQQQNGIIEGERVLQANITVQNDTTTSIYYAPNVYVFVNDEQLANEAERLTVGDAVAPVPIEPAANATFTVAFRLPSDVLAQQATMQIPVAFTEPNSTSSGDALGDFGEWTLSLHGSGDNKTH